MSKSLIRAALATALTLSLAGIIGCGGYSGSNGNWNNGGWNNGNNGWQGNNNGTRTITCESDNGRRRTCSAGMYIGRAEIAQRTSNTPCQLGRTWGYSGNTIWVDQGCRAEFRVYAQGNGGGGYNPNNGGWNGNGGNNNGNNGNNGNSSLMTCESQDGGRHRCYVGFPIQKAEIAERYSDTRCQKGQTWGINGQNLWVDQGCRAKFRVYR
jgi:hypothetical protein